MTFDQFLRQPTTIAGLSGLTATLGSIGTGHLTWTQAAPYLVASLVAIVLRDNTVLPPPSSSK